MSKNEVEVDELTTRYCFRCKNMAVLDMGHLRLLPMVLDRARYLLMKGKYEGDDAEEAWGVQDSLSIYKNILEGLSID